MPCVHLLHSRPLDRRAFIGLTGASAAAVVLAACNGASDTVSNLPADDSGELMTVNYESMFAQYAPAEEPDGDPAMVTWPEYVTGAAPEIQELYAFHIDSGRVMRYMPCYCGCGGSDHHNNRDCYVRQVNADGSILFDSMAPT